MIPLRIFIGYDPREAVAYHVLAHSIIRRASRPVSITPLALDHLRGIYTRERDPRQSTDFTYTRFLVPHLSGYEGVSIYMDCDMLCRTDLWELHDTIWWKASDLREVGLDTPATWVVQHDYVPRGLRYVSPSCHVCQSGREEAHACLPDARLVGTKMDGLVQTAYPRKNWSSLMVFNNARCRVLTPEYVARASGMDLHRFAWLRDEEIGALPLTWNWLVGEYAPNPDARLLHYTLGGPWFEDTRDCDHAEEWLAERDHMLCESFARIG